MKNPFRKPTSTELAETQLGEAELDLLKAQAALEEWQAQVGMLQKRVARLRDHSKQNTIEAFPPIRLQEAA